MKNIIYFILLLLFIAESLKGQDVQPLNIAKNFIRTDFQEFKSTKKLNEYRAPHDTISFWDFNGGLPAGWTNVDNTSNNYIWIWSTIGPIGAYTGSPWNVPDAALASTTGANGFMMFQADNYNTNQTTGVILSNYIAHDSYIMTDAIDLSSHPSVVVKFQERFRACCTWSGAGLWLGVSTNGTTWTDYLVNDGVVINDQSAMDDAVNDITLNISSVAGGQSTVYLRWYIQGLSHYYWMVDDVAIVEGVDNDAKIEREYIDFFSINSGTYTKIPLTQSSNFPIGFRTAVLNNAINNLTNMILNVNIDYLGSTIFNENSSIEYPIPLIGSTIRDTILCVGSAFYTSNVPPNPSFYANNYGDYTITYSLNMDQADDNPSDNTVISTFAITDSVYARDDGSDEGRVAPQDWVGHGLDGDIFGVTYMINDDLGNTEVNSLSLYVDISSDITNPTTIRGVVYLSDGAGGYDEIISTNSYTISSSDLDSWLTLPLAKDGFSEFLPEGNYLAAIEYIAYNGGDGLWIGEDLDTRQMQWATLWQFSDDPGAWFYLSNYGLDQTPMIRLNFNSICHLAFIDSLINITDESVCGIGDGAIDITLDFSNPPLSFLWSNSATTEDISGLYGGQYSITITDNENCHYYRNFTINSLDVPSFNANITNESSCGFHDGEIDITPSGGTSPYTFLWSDNSITEDLDSLGSGTYALTMTDDYGCSFTQIYNVVYLDSVSISGIITDESFCGFSDGSIDITINNGTPPYNFNWSNGSTDEDPTNLSEGLYSVLVTDDNGCSSVNNFSIVFLDSLSITGISNNESFCGFSDGSIDITINDGTPPYNFNWSNGSTDEDPTNLSEGLYSVSVTDNNGCLNLNSFNVFYIDSLSIILDSIIHSSGPTFSSGAIYISIINGTPPYSILWSNSATTEDITDILGGSSIGDSLLYSVEVLDSNNCINNASFYVYSLDVYDISKREFYVSQNYPNPFGNITRFDIELTNSMNISYEITDIAGKKLIYENFGILHTGKHTIDINTTHLADGIYYYTVNADNKTFTRKMVIIK